MAIINNHCIVSIECKILSSDENIITCPLTLLYKMGDAVAKYVNPSGVWKELSKLEPIDKKLTSDSSFSGLFTSKMKAGLLGKLVCVLGTPSLFK